MHQVIVFACVLAVASAQGIPTPHGTITNVADTPEVQLAKAQHFAAHAAARGHVYAAPVYAGYAGYPHFGYGYAAAGYPIAGIPTAHGVITNVADTPEVQLAKHQHFAAHAAARAGLAPIAGIPTAHGVITGVAETQEVVAAKAQHFAAHAQALARSG